MFVTELENEGITKSLQETEDWLYEDSDDECDEQIYTGKLEDLKKVCRKCYSVLLYLHNFSGIHTSNFA